MSKSELQNQRLTDLSMVDIHCHILPEIDDGSVSMEESVEMCRMAAEDGIKTIVATPHMFDGVHKTPDRETILRRIDAVMESAKGCVEIVPGGEVRYSHEIFDESRDPLSRIRLNGGSYMLLEFPFQMVPPNIENTIFQILNAGITPVIAHPERNKRLQRHPEILASLLERGAFSQLDAGSLTGSFGEEAFESAKKILRGGMAHFIATDAHHAGRRRPNLTEAVMVAAGIIGTEAARMLVENNPRALIQDKGIPWQPDPDLDALLGRSGKKWFQFWKQ
jgi:protein-tyrosine phosphatase